MHLYEVTNGWIGESYVRVYAWADDEVTALAMARAAYARDRPDSVERLIITHLFSATDNSFVTDPSDSGWGTDARA